MREILSSIEGRGRLMNGSGRSPPGGLLQKDIKEEILETDPKKV